jgi:outer membrane protein assembly factor BamB
VWRQSLGAELASTLTVDGDRLYVSLADSTLAALEVTSGAPIWRVKTPGIPGRVTVAGDRLFAGCADDFFYAFDATDGDRRWRWRTGADVLAPAAQDGERVYFTARDNVVRAVAFGSGVQKWRHAMDTRPLAGPARDQDVVILAGAGELRVLAAKNGSVVGRWTAPGELAVPPVFPPSDNPNGVRAVIVTGATTGDWRVYALARSAEPEPAPLKETPGRPLSPEGPPPLPSPPSPVSPRLP